MDTINVNNNVTACPTCGNPSSRCQPCRSQVVAMRREVLFQINDDEEEEEKEDLENITMEQLSRDDERNRTTRSSSWTDDYAFMLVSPQQRWIEVMSATGGSGGHIIRESFIWIDGGFACQGNANAAIAHATSIFVILVPLDRPVLLFRGFPHENDVEARLREIMTHRFSSDMEFATLAASSVTTTSSSQQHTQFLLSQEDRKRLHTILLDSNTDSVFAWLHKLKSTWTLGITDDDNIEIHDMVIQIFRGMVLDQIIELLRVYAPKRREAMQLWRCAGCLYQILDDFNHATFCCETSLAILDELVPVLEESVERVEAIDNLAEVALCCEDYDLAEIRFSESLAMNRAYASNHGTFESICVPLRNLVHVLLSRSKTTRAKPLIMEGIELSERFYGNMHPVKASWLRLLVEVLLEEKKYDEAKKASRKSLDIHRAAYGSMHPDVAMDLLTIASLFDANDDVAVQIRFLDEAIDIRDHVFGSFHPLTITARKARRSLVNNDGPSSHHSVMGSTGSFDRMHGRGGGIRTTGDEDVSLV